MKNILVLFFIAGTVQLLTAQKFPSNIPEFSIYAEDGSEFTQKDLVNDKNIFFIYFNPGCGHCKDAFRELNLNYKNLNLKDLQVYPISAGTKEETKMFFKGLAPNLLELDNMEVIYDENYRFADAFFVGGFPHAFLYDKKHKFVNSFQGKINILEAVKNLENE